MLGCWFVNCICHANFPLEYCSPKNNKVLKVFALNMITKGLECVIKIYSFSLHFLMHIGGITNDILDLLENRVTDIIIE